MSQVRASHRAVSEKTPLPTATGALARLAAARASQTGVDIVPLLSAVGLPADLMTDTDTRVDVRSQIRLLNSLSEMLGDPLLGFHLAQESELREFGPFYYAVSSAEKIGTAFDRIARYSTTINEGVYVLRAPDTCVIEFEYVGVERHIDQHQLEFWSTCIIRMCRLFTGRDIVPTYIGFLHQPAGDASEMERYFGCNIEFGVARDRLSFEPVDCDLPLVTADPYLSQFLKRYYDDESAKLLSGEISLRIRVENAIMARLPHGTASIGTIANDLGMSARTLSRRLAEEGSTFSTILEELRSVLAYRYLQNVSLSISEIAWLLGYAEVSSFAHAFQRWTGSSPTSMRRRMTAPS
jgi:AraC-like DNA-binding protein